ncbi:MAG: antibiotic biosynthesis monooxygenase [Desulfobacteraceae bacterium]|nr:MAG: antibiotic biosynthesis monooxygenase [Desulfobacteraceae bacterium]
MISVIAKLSIQEGKAEQTIEMFKEMLKKVATEEGTLLYSLNRKPSDPNTIVVIERYKDKPALAAHSSTAHFKEFSAKLGAVLAAKPDIAILDELEAVEK